ncbi:hypothetical protein [Pseudomonas meliae]|uniref:Uncharacterized protein n=1 Tax=Pseudomonas meliae TaxID=86176 RepID=A0A0P9W1L0_9PSED|nr:hypothetical protein [Pseudomonas meliae]KPX93501.1 Uncharacterized protein ALO64_00445 [Pseudomonas meliae]
MHIIWWVLRPFYWLGLVPVIAVFLISCFQFNRDTEVSLGIMAIALAYFGFGYLLFSIAPRYFKSRLFRMVETAKLSGFNPSHEAVSVMYNRYVGFDSGAKKALYVDVNLNSSTLIDFDQVSSWELLPDKSPHLLFRLITRVPNLREIGVRIKANQFGAWKSDMHSLFG